MFGSDVPIVLISMQEKSQSLMGQDRGCRVGYPISPISGDECVLLCPLLCGVLHYRPRTKPLEAYCHSCSLVINLGTHLHLFPACHDSAEARTIGTLPKQ
ncbi:hypothetical protein AVEN_194989-1 [Araneus ventricosus]|uniref:LITAF domain-containing protein n=1 Tax=Araneus ventricosus TaxID=182803 RepID=A0A4Y2HP09_ARAVE|nr:hypothetical protein AVEN_194989-1 [Araneus ventricosus]